MTNQKLKFRLYIRPIMSPLVPNLLHSHSLPLSSISFYTLAIYIINIKFFPPPKLLSWPIRICLRQLRRQPRKVAQPKMAAAMYCGSVKIDDERINTTTKALQLHSPKILTHQNRESVNIALWGIEGSGPNHLNFYLILYLVFSLCLSLIFLFSLNIIIFIVLMS